tara:strand:- start:9225 stop:9947 length:723 start_codon:yes stop_codon:yes gene_type:complete
MPGNFLIVGGNSDIAKVLTENLLSQDANITLLVRQENLPTDPTKSIDIVVGDATQEGDLQKAVQTASDKGTLDGIVHCVGSIVIRPPHAMKKEGFEEVISTNLTSAFLTLSIGGKSMLRNGGGRMVFCSSVAGSIGLVNHEAISAAKGGIESMVRSAAATYAQRGLRINAVAPGLTDTKMASKILASDAMRETAESKIPLRRLNQKQEIAQTIHWLLTAAPDNMTGQVLHLDGGMSNILV